MILIQNGIFCNPKTRQEGHYDVLLLNGQVLKIAEHGQMGDFFCKSSLRVIDASGCIVAPGLVDVHAHFRDPGFAYKEDILTGGMAAAAGGFTTIVMMANTKPPIDSVETLEYVLKKGLKTGIRVKSCACVTQGMQGKKLVDFQTLRIGGAAGFTDDGIPLMDEALVLEAMKQSAALGVPISFHEEDKAYITNNGVNAGAASEHYGIGGSPREAEISLIRRDLKLALQTGAIMDIQHISSAEGVQLVREARKQSANIHAEATPHHIALTEEAVIQKGTMAKMNPPLRTEADRQAILAGLADGTIDLIATDHAPHSAQEKAKPITEAPSGIIGLETALAICNQELVARGLMSRMDMLAKLTCNPADMYGLNAGNLVEGGRADLVIYREDETWTPQEFLSKSQNSPFLGEQMKGRVHYTICDGKIVYEL